MSLPPCAVFDIVVRIDFADIFSERAEDVHAMNFEDHVWMMVFKEVKQPPQHWRSLFGDTPAAPVNHSFAGARDEESQHNSLADVFMRAWKHNPPSSIEEMKEILLKMKQKMLFLIDNCHWWPDPENARRKIISASEGEEKDVRCAKKQDIETFITDIVRGTLC